MQHACYVFHEIRVKIRVGITAAKFTNEFCWRCGHGCGCGSGCGSGCGWAVWEPFLRLAGHIDFAGFCGARSTIFFERCFQIPNKGGDSKNSKRWQLDIFYYNFFPSPVWILSISVARFVYLWYLCICRIPCRLHWKKFTSLEHNIKSPLNEPKTCVIELYLKTFFKYLKHFRFFNCNTWSVVPKS